MKQYRHKPTNVIATETGINNNYRVVGLSENQKIGLIHKSFIENSNDWTEIKDFKKSNDYTILRFREKLSDYLYFKSIIFDGYKGINNIRKTYSEIMNNIENYDILEVRKEDTKEIFKVGDDYPTRKGITRIKEFNITLNNTIFIYTESGNTIFLEDWKKVQRFTYENEICLSYNDIVNFITNNKSHNLTEKGASDLQSLVISKLNK